MKTSKVDTDLKAGLPDYFVDIENNYVNLKKTLNLTRDRIKALLSSNRAKEIYRTFKHMKINMNNKFYILYALPRERLLMFLQYISASEKDRTNIFVPSLEYKILEKYNGNFHENEFDEKNLLASDNEWQAILDEWESKIGKLIIELDAEALGYLKNCFMTWIKIKTDINRWDTLDETNKINVSNAIFALSTLTMSNRLLERSIEINNDLASFFRAILDDSEKVKESVTAQWHELLQSIINLCTEGIENGPSVQRLDDIAIKIEELKSHRDSISEQDREKTIDENLMKLMDLIQSTSREEGFDWLDTSLIKQLKARWLLAINEAEKYDNHDKLMKDVNRALEDVKRNAEILREYILNINSLNENIADIGSKVEKSPPAERRKLLSEQRKLESKKSDVSSHIFDSEAIFLNEASPFKKQFNYEKDYEKLLGEVSSAKPSSELGLKETKSKVKTNGSKTDNGDRKLKDPIKDKPQNKPTSSPSIPTEEKVDPFAKTTSPVDKDDKNIDKKNKAKIKDKKTEELTLPIESDENVNPKVKEANKLIWTLIENDRLGLAYQLSKSLENVCGNSCTQIPSSIIHALSISPHVHMSYGEAFDELHECVGDVTLAIANIHNNKENVISQALIFIIFSLLLRPSLLLARLGVSNIIQSLPLPKYIESIHNLREETIKISSLGFELSTNVLKGVREHSAWEQTLQQIRSECGTWVESYRRITILYKPSTNVWKHWLKKESELGSIIDAVISNNTKCIAEVKHLIQHWSNPSYVKKQIDATDKISRGKTIINPIQARAVKSLLKHVDNALVIPQQWIAHVEDEPQSNDYKYKKVAEHRNQLLNQLDKSLSEIESILHNDSKPPEISASLKVLSKSLYQLKSLFDPNTADVTQNVQLHYILNGDMLRIPGIIIDEKWKPLDPDWDKILDNLLSFANSTDPDWNEIFKNQLKHHDHNLTYWILEYIEFKGIKIDLDKAKQEREKCIENERAELKLNIQNTRKDLEKALSYDLISESDRNTHLTFIENTNISEVLNFSHISNKLIDIRSEIKKAKEERTNILKEQLKKELSPTKASKRDIDRIMKLLDNGDILIANEYAEMIQSGKDLPSSDTSLVKLNKFFPSFTSEIEKYLGDYPMIRGLANKIKEGKRIGPLDMNDVPGKQADEASKMIRAWGAAKSKSGNILDFVSDVLTGLGFNVIGVKKESEYSWKNEKMYILDATTLPIIESETCVVPAYASKANGQYKILCCWDRPSEEEIFEFVGNRIKNVPFIIFYFARLSNQRRKDFSFICKERHKTILMFDECLIYFLCAERGLRLPSFFKCSFPFTRAMPYTTVAGSVPPEMFFGRKKAREEIINPSGSNLVYGGRQLGKTALLRDVEYRENNPENGSIVKWIDLKYEGIGINRQVDEIWVVISKVLQNEAIISKHLTKPESIADRIVDWLGENSKNRLILLLDEADTFMKLDRNNKYSNIERIKGLMDKTNRRFKAVFSGLHNVQRTSTDINSPLAHLGAPLCIGPLWADGEWREAVKLIKLPFETLGYSFESDDLIWHILSHTNYYPSLIQIFCKNLLEQLHDSGYSSSQSPPYKITLQHIEDAYQNSKLRGEIIDRFKWTLNLDQRYRFFALRIACDALDNSENNLVDGYDVAWCKNEALSYWSKGFEEESSSENIKTILDEMIGLGVLRKIHGNRYTLRNPNVINLLGIKTEIEDELLEICSQSAPIEINEAGTLRRELKKDHIMRSPLTFQQESELLKNENSVSIIFGSEMSGIDNFKEYFHEACQQHMADLIYIQTTEHSIFEKKLNKMLSTKDKQTDRNIKIAIISSDSPWNENWIKYAADHILNKQPKKHFTKVVFIAEPWMCWSWITVDKNIRDQLYSLGVAELSLQPWSLSLIRLWIDANNLGSKSDESFLNKITEVTGKWSKLLYEFSRRNTDRSKSWKLYLADLNESISESYELLKPFSLFDEVVPVLKTMAQYDDQLSIEEIIALGSFGNDIILKTIEWGERLSVIHQVERNRWVLDELLKKAVINYPNS